MSDILTMCKTVISSLRKKTACQMYPVKPAKFYKNTRGHITIDPNKCMLCTLCARRCPTGAIEVDRAKGTWQINRFKCITCNECVLACKPVALSMEMQYAPPGAKKDIELHNIEIKKPVPKPAATGESAEKNC